MWSENNGRSSINTAWMFLLGSAVLFLGAIGMFIWLLMDAAEDSYVKNILYGAAFLVITTGLFLYAFFARKAPRFFTTLMWACMGVGLAIFIVGLCIKDPEPLRLDFEDGTPPTEVVID